MLAAVEVERLPGLGPFCAGWPNSAGDGARISYAGSTSFAANDFTLEVDGIPGLSSLLFLQSAERARVPLADGVLCLGISL